MGPRSNTAEEEDALASAMRALTKAMADQGITRLVALSGAGTNVPGDRKPLVDRLMSRLVGVAARHVLGAKQREFEVFSSPASAPTQPRWVLLVGLG
jgi:hypothetical protein